MPADILSDQDRGRKIFITTSIISVSNSAETENSFKKKSAHIYCDVPDTSEQTAQSQRGLLPAAPLDDVWSV